MSTQAQSDSQINVLGVVPWEHALSSRAQKHACSARSPQATQRVITLQSAYEDLLKAHGISSKWNVSEIHLFVCSCVGIPYLWVKAALGGPVTV